MAAEPVFEATDADAQRDERLLALLKALADHRRLAIIRLLQDGTYCNCELGEELGVAPNLISHHLKALRDVGLVDAERHPTDARWILYSLNRSVLDEARMLCTTLLDRTLIGDRLPASCRTDTGAPCPCRSLTGRPELECQ